MTNPVVPAFRTGGDDAAEASKQVPFARGSHLDYLRLDDGERILLRYITSYADLVYVAQHSSCPTKAAPPNYAKKWPEAMTAVCRKDEAFAQVYSDCYICDAKIKNRWGNVVSNAVKIWALAVVREEVIGDGSEEKGGPEKKGIRVGTVDKMVEVEVVDKDGKATGEKVWQKQYLLVNFAHKNYFSNLKAAYHEFGSINDRDFAVTRQGKDTDTVYPHFALDATPNLKPGTDRWKEKYLDDLDERGINLLTIIAERASDEYYAKFFDPSKSVDDKGNITSGSAPAASSSSEAPAATDAEEEARMAALRDRVASGGRPTPAQDID